ncbi:cobalamin B12-binding domain-containing protein [Streptomyces sp. LP11]|uniref:Cobalamin B12-binding domain-containing protein n=1 Tax=Streptomyces pyxinicus TaxID=2970331 RepID=A0ABT2B3C6_9ACTN|nr:cobalamin B12-binding domain-containing protein [Streptomyces sp. LP11]MCS0603027.1 cobalamin B12-binding domain-containing protein [Streptomyces sp. LP11]
MGYAGDGADKEGLAPQAGLTTGAVARRLGVSPTTLRSWDRRYGLGPASRAEGRHRRWSPRDVAMVEEMCRLAAAGAPPAEAARVARLTHGERVSAASPVPRAAAVPAGVTPRRGGPGGGLPLGDVRQECRGLARAAVRLDAPELASRLLDAVGQHGLIGAWEEVMVPTLRAVGRKWESSGDRYVEVEHLLSWQISTTLRRANLVLPHAADPVGGDPVVLACVPGEQHSLPLEALEAALEGQGVPTRMLGAAVPVEALLACVRRTGPAAVVLWAQSRSTASMPLARHVGDLRWGPAGARRRPLVLPAGPGWSRRTAEGFLRCTGLAEAVRTLSTLSGADGAVRRPSPGRD